MINDIKILISGSFTGWKSTIISVENFINNYIYGECSQAYRQYLKNNCLYRGDSKLEDNRIHKLEPLYRYSEGDLPNIYTMLFSGILPSWKKYPKRNHCVIGTTSPSDAKQWADKEHSFYLFPFNGTKIGIAPTDDLWHSFQGKKILLKDFDDTIKNFLVKFLHYQNNIQFHNVKEVIKAFNDIGIFLHNLSTNRTDLELEKYLQNISMQTIILHYLIKYKDNLIEGLDQLFNPESVGIKLETISKFKNPLRPREIWFDAPCLAISIPSMDKIEKEINKIAKKSYKQKILEEQLENV